MQSSIREYPAQVEDTDALMLPNADINVGEYDDNFYDTDGNINMTFNRSTAEIMPMAPVTVEDITDRREIELPRPTEQQYKQQAEILPVPLVTVEDITDR